MRRALPHLASAAIAIAIVATSLAACSIGEGRGSVSGVLNVPDCWSGRFDLQPDFFAAVPYRNTNLELRIQNGGDFETFSDGIEVLIENLAAIREHTVADGGTEGEIGQALPVSLPPEVTPPGVPIVPTSNPARVHLALYLQRTCRTQNAALYALDTVSLNANGNCDPSDDAGGAVLTCPSQLPDGTPVQPAPAADGGPSALDGGAPDASSADAGAGAASAPVGHSTITFDSLFNNDVEETRADNRRNKGSFHVYLADPREICPGGIGPPPPCRGELKGSFDFYFERGRPAQPFP